MPRYCRALTYSTAALEVGDIEGIGRRCGSKVISGSAAG
jgi:hypothetical protein